MKFVLEMEQLFAFALQHSRNRNAGPAGNNFSNFFGTDFFFNQCRIDLHQVEFLFKLFEFCNSFLGFTVAKFGNKSVIPLTFSLFCFELVRFDVLFLLLYAVNQVALCFPFCFQSFTDFIQVSNFFVKVL